MLRFLCFILLISLLLGCNSSIQDEEKQSVDSFIIFTVDCFLAGDNLTKLLEDFPQQENLDIEIITFKDSYEIYNYLASDSTDILPDVIIGITNVDPRIAEIESRLVNLPKDLNSKIKNKFKTSSDKLIPVYFHDLAFVFDNQQIENPPSSFGAMQDGFWKDKIILPDPANTNLGRAMLIWSVAAFGKNGYSHFWRSMKENIFKIESNWDTGYRQFLAQESPIVLGFTSIEMYHKSKGNFSNISTFIPQEGGFRVITFAAILEGTRHPILANKFIEYLLEKEFQNRLISSIYALPVIEMEEEINQNINLPYSNNYYENTIKISDISTNYNTWINRWNKIMR